MKAIRLILAVLALGLAAPTVLAHQTPRQLIAQLGLDTRASDSGDWTRQREAEKTVARQLHRFILERPGDPSLTAVDSFGRSPLMEAAVNGYAEVVEALLTDAGVRSRIDDSDQFGATAWALSQFGRPITLIACHPRMYTRERLPLLKPYARRIGYFREGATTSFTRIARSLVNAGAQVDPMAAKAAWMAHCPETEESLRQRLQVGDDLPQVLWGYTLERLQQFRRDMDSSNADLKTEALPGPLLPGINTADAPPQPLLRASLHRADGTAPDTPKTTVLCTRMDKPDIPLVPWSGKLTFRLVVELQAGMPTVVDIRLTSGSLEPRSLAVFQAGLLRTLASYECVGDHFFEQEIEFQIQ